MNAPASHIRFLLSKSLLLSFFAHLLVLSGVIIVWPQIPAAHKPNFNFLGSILSASEVTMRGLSAQDSERTPTGAYKFQDRSPSLFDTGLSKPKPNVNHSPEEKRTVKETQPEEPREIIPPPSRQQQEAIDTPLEPYKPLRLKAND